LDWKKLAVDDLRNYNLLQQSMQHIPQRIAALETEAVALKSSFSDCEPVSGSKKDGQDRLLSNICQRQRLHCNLEAVRSVFDMMERAFFSLLPDEQLVLRLFFIDRQSGHMERLQQELGYENAQIYRIKDQALRKFTLAMYGVLEL
jgi:hypothetical protein